MQEKLSNSFLRLVEVIHELREKCPWDIKQTNESLRHLTIEEVYELSEAILAGDEQEIKNEAGDILLHVLFYARIGEEKGTFTTVGMMDSLREKLIRRHPHIYGEVVAEDAGTVSKNWEQIKLSEGKGEEKSVLSGVPGGLPALIKALRIQEKVSNVGFDWEEQGQVSDKVKEEVDEFLEEVTLQKSPERIEEEFGDLLFALVNYARFLNINPEDALERANQKFRKRFEYIEQKVFEAGSSIGETALDEMEKLWKEAKKNLL